MRALLLITTTILTLLVQPIWANERFESYEDCLIKSLKGVTNDKAVSLINTACSSAYDTSQAANLKQIATLESQINQLTHQIKILESKLRHAKFDAGKEIEAIIQRKMKERQAECEQVSNPSPSNGSNDQISATFFEFSGTFTTNLAASRKMLQIGIGISTKSDGITIRNVQSHQLALRSVILGVISEFSEDEVKGDEGRKKLAEALRDAINSKLETLEKFGGIEAVHFTSFVVA